MADKATTRLTQHDIARMTGVSQATVSLVLNGRSDATARIPPETRDRVLKAIRETGYVADPIARRLPSSATASSACSPTSRCSRARSGDFYHPFLVGIEERRRAARLRPAAAHQRAGASTAGGGSSTRTTGCASPTAASCSAARSTATSWPGWSPTGYPFVSVGRRDDAGGPVPVRRRRLRRPRPPRWSQQARRARATGGSPTSARARGAESHADRWRGFTRRVGGRPARRCSTDRRPAAAPPSCSTRCCEPAVTAVFVEEHADASRCSTRRRSARPRRPGRPVRRRARRADPAEPRRHVDVHRLPHPAPRRWAAQAIDVLERADRRRATPQRCTQRAAAVRTDRRRHRAPAPRSPPRRT